MIKNTKKMRHFIGAILSVWLVLGAGYAGAQNTGAQNTGAQNTGGSAEPDPVVVELFTSQGCVSCPPADAALAGLAARPDVIALSLHVNYWDYLGWKDSFAQGKFTTRQKGYARAAGKRMIYTPQMVIGGREHVVGNKPREIERLIQSHRAKPSGVTLSVTRKGGRIHITARTDTPQRRPLWVQLVRVRDDARVQIKSGENAGRKIDYSNTVTQWLRIGPWDSTAPLDLNRSIRGDDSTAVIIQSPDFGPVLAAAWAR